LTYLYFNNARGQFNYNWPLAFYTLSASESMIVPLKLAAVIINFNFVKDSTLYTSKALAKRFAADKYVAGILAGNRVLLSQAITLVESRLPSDQELAHEVMDKVLPHTGNSIRIGITGVPGVGKSTFIETFGTYLIQTQNKKL